MKIGRERKKDWDRKGKRCEEKLETRLERERGIVSERQEERERDRDRPQRDKRKNRKSKGR